jgi:tetratricopeptide (TPR) repeat protein
MKSVLAVALGVFTLAAPESGGVQREPSEEQARALEEALKAKPDDLVARSVLLEYYFLRGWRSEPVRERRQAHALWVIANHPEAAIAGRPQVQLLHPRDAEAYQRAKALWTDHVKSRPRDTRILGNAASFLLIRDRDLAEQILTQAQALEPQNPVWSERLGHLHKLDMHPGADGASTEMTAGRALQEYERALAATNDRGGVLEDAATAALEAGQPEKARAYATELLQGARPGVWSYGNAVHHGNLVLGRLALREGDVEGSKQYLKKAGETPGSPQLNSFGPNMTLARELLEKGEKDAVLEYFAQCSRFWSMGGERLQSWTAMVKGGGIPDFGANLRY